MKVTEFTLERTVTQTVDITIITADDEDPEEVMKAILHDEDLPKKYEIGFDEEYPDLLALDWQDTLRLPQWQNMSIKSSNPWSDPDKEDLTMIHDHFRTPRAGTS